ncbi:glycine zipper 2TM domain-containing protein [Herbaspirillum sp. YR522]|uniref:glycine zipper 2TM domain-containing protein n=1 Tax=Herbaspirillum sp. YR522 TaxID=1144342 RepID=UPI00026FAAC5|nr:glycine zipper 2TM domain-containing protein [Herbaspirillum sp. YR522]EJN08810.1 outer membrane lipoprotein [Herbaspirillum sp. YR522]
MKKFIAVAALGLMATGCAVTPNSASVYNTRQAQGEQTVRMAVVESIRNVTIDKGASGVGTLAGGALGGIAAGSNIGGGNGALAAGIVGALAGGVVGNQVESRVANRPGLEITVRLENGELRAITQDADEAFRVGERVRLLSNGRTTRVTH